MAKKDKAEVEALDAIDRLEEYVKKNKHTDKFKEKMKEISKGVDDYKNRYKDANKYGKQIAKRINKKYANIPVKHEGKIYYDKGIKTDEVSSVISEILYNCYMKSEDNGCRELLNEWVNDKLWGKIVKAYLPQLKRIWQFLHDNKYDKNNTLGFGDVDGDIWVEYVKQEHEWPDNRKIIIHTSHCSCADDNTHIFILDEEATINAKLHVRTVWPRQDARGGYRVTKSKKHPKGWFLFGDDRDIRIPSLNTYRKRNFEYSYQDCRDKGYSLSLTDFGGPKIEWATTHQSRILHAIWLIRLMTDIIDDQDKEE